VSTLARSMSRRFRGSHEGEETQRELRVLATVVQDSNDAVTIQDLEGSITHWNRGAEKLYGYSEEEARRLNIVELVPEQRRDEERSMLEMIKHGEEVESVETQRLTKDGRRLDVWLTVTKLVDDAGKPYAAAFTERNITQRKQMERNLRRLANSNRDLEEFARVASHELREPLRKIRLFGDKLHTTSAEQLSAEGRDYIERMNTAAGRMDQLLDDLFTLARVSARPEPFVQVQLTEVMQHVASDLALQIEEVGARVEIGDLPTIHGDPRQMYRLFQNLVSNALKFRSDQEAPVIKIHGRFPTGNGQRLPHDLVGFRQIVVEDNGIGFDEKHVDRIFGVFERLHGRGRYEGTGMGLAICRRITDRHGGYITASTLGKGSTFIVTLPLKPAEETETDA
jgi:PAS domain S-box-containing protein